MHLTNPSSNSGDCAQSPGRKPESPVLSPLRALDERREEGIYVVDVSLRAKGTRQSNRGLVQGLLGRLAHVA